MPTSPPRWRSLGSSTKPASSRKACFISDDEGLEGGRAKPLNPSHWGSVCLALPIKEWCLCSLVLSFLPQPHDTCLESSSTPCRHPRITAPNLLIAGVPTVSYITVILCTSFITNGILLRGHYHPFYFYCYLYHIFDRYVIKWSLRPTPSLSFVGSSGISISHSHKSLSKGVFL